MIRMGSVADPAESVRGSDDSDGPRYDRSAAQRSARAAPQKNHVRRRGRCLKNFAHASVSCGPRVDYLSRLRA